MFNRLIFAVFKCLIGAGVLLVLWLLWLRYGTGLLITGGAMIVTSLLVLPLHLKWEKSRKK